MPDEHPRGRVPRAAVRGLPLADRQTKEIRRVFEYHGAEHKTIAAFEHGDELVPERIDTYPKEHVRCGTNFLIIVMVITIFVFTLFGTPACCGGSSRASSRSPSSPASRTRRCGWAPGSQSSLVMRGLMAPGIWLQKITTQKPDDGQIEVGVASFREVLRREAEAAGTSG